MNFDQAFEKLLGREGGYSNHRADKGGQTNWGITEAVARAQCYYGSMQDLTQFQAKAIYRQCYWTPLLADQLPAEVRFDVFDGAVNSGVTQSTKWLQRALGVDDDGIIGPRTLAAAALVPGGVLKAQYNGHRLAFMASLPNWVDFGKGWARRIAKNLVEV
ncbi:MAG: glycoside hydrolase family 108 protein [Rhodoferax sp.]|nr:glycoside hydrolase family 108 protein [Rhodoferax sp.]